jgi:hypothetical protein
MEENQIATYFLRSRLFTYDMFVEEKAHGTNQNIDGFYTKTTQKGGFSKLCVKIKKTCYTDLLHFSTRKHNLVSFFGQIVF